MPLVEQFSELSHEEYRLFRDLVYAHSGINLGDEKLSLVRARLGKRMRQGQFNSFRAYYEFVRQDESGQELSDLIDAISTNTTHLFRESKHFDFLARLVQGWAAEQPRGASKVLRVWSAACSSGEEPYSIAITLRAALRDKPSVQCKILATDISNRILEKAKRGQFEEEKLQSVPPALRQAYFVGSGSTFEVTPDVRSLITFAHFNLMTETFPFRNPFDVIFCRNVMIYFDKPTQQALVNRFARHLRPGGYLLIGHSESLSSLDQPLKYISPTIYQKA